MIYNNSQSMAIRHKDGPMLVLAGPGSGKTAVITKRTENLINVYGIDPGTILVITFTRAAAAEMKSRFLQLIGRPTAVTFGTFHAVFFTILKAAYHYSGANIVTEEQKNAFLREILSWHHLDYQDEGEMIAQILAEISSIKNSRLDIAHYSSTSCAPEVFRKIYASYEKKMRENRLIDYDDMLTYTWDLLNERKDILKIWRQKFRYILVDEFQDINQIQYDILRLLAAPHNNLFIVGDDDQSIYRFRGSRPEIMLNFRKDYPDAKQVLLNVNYRSTVYITETAKNLISHNTERYEKEIVPSRKEKTPVQYLTFENRRTEILYILQEISRRMKEGAGLSDFAILFRTNSQARLITEQLSAYNIPFRVRDHVPNLYESWIAKDIFAYLRLAGGSRTREDFLQIMNRPKRYIGRDSLTQSRVDMKEWKKGYEGQPWIAERIARLEYDLDMMQKMNPYAAINYLRKGVCYEDYLKEYAAEHNLDAKELIDMLDDIQFGAKGFRTVEEWQEHIREYTAKMKTMAAAREKSTNSITLATLHSSKGLEFSTVFLLDVNEGITPYKKAVLSQDIEEERRLFYVGMTRAKDNLYICSVKSVREKETQISRFVEETRHPVTIRRKS